MIRNPQALGLSATDWRPGQRETITKIIESPIDTVVIDAPTGSGKSLIALGTARATLAKTFIVTHTKSLQDQYIDEGGDLVKSIRGKNNYLCVLPIWDRWEATTLGVTKFTTVDNAPCAVGYDCAYRDRCTYFMAKRAAVQAPISIHNDAYWVLEANTVGEFSNAGYVFFDEGHLVDDVLTRWAGMEILPEFGMPTGTTARTWRSWAKEVLVAAGSGPVAGVERVKWERRMRDVQRLADLDLDSGTRWVLDWGVRDGARVRPLWPVGFRETLLKGSKLVLMSGTILDHEMFAETVGMGEHEYIKLPWTFPKESRPVFYRPAAAVTRTNQEAAAPNLARVVDHVMDTHRGEKGVIHCRSFNLGEAVARELKHKNIIVHTRGMDRARVVRQFKEGKNGEWLISPSVSHGEDFAYDVARCQVILKMPFPDYGDQLVRLRAKANPAWYYYATAQELVQMVGRVTRAPDDYGETIICDEKFDVFVDKYRRFIPEELWAAVS